MGLIINECFTKQNPAGVDFGLIADTYPLFYELDTLVSNMIKQNPDERFTIDTVITELKFIHGKNKHTLEEIKEELLYSDCPQILNEKSFNKIIQRASEDLLFAEIVFKNKSVEEIRRYNRNWHMKIGYLADSFLINLYVQEKIFQECKRKFNKESNVDVFPLNLLDNEAHKQIALQMKDILSQFTLNKGYERRFDLSRRIYKYFTSCYDYHCKEILENVRKDNFFQQEIERLLDAPILWIVSLLKEVVIENIDSLADINLTEHIQINWDRTQYFESNADEIKLIESLYIDEKNELNKILSEFQKKWKIVYSRIDNDFYSIKFENYNQFSEFREYAVQLSKPYHIFHGDVLDIVKHYSYIDNIIEIKVSVIFDIPDVLAKILGFRNDY